MSALLILATIVLGVTFAWIAAINWYAWFIRTYRRASTSWLPLIGGACGVAACFVEPSGVLRTLWWLPLLLDYGSAPGLLHTAFFHARRRRRLSHYAVRNRVLADGTTAWFQKIDGAVLAELVATQLPELSTAVQSCGGLLHLQVSAIGEELLRRVSSGQVEAALAILTFFDDALKSRRPAGELANALQVSFVTGDELRATDAGRRVLELAPEQVRSVIEGTAQ